MNPADILPARFTGPASAGPARSVAQKDGDAAQGEEGGFSQTMKSVSQERDGTQGAGGAKSAEERKGRSTDKPQDAVSERWPRLVAEKGIADASALMHAAQAEDEDPADNDVGRGDDKARTDAPDPGAAQGKDPHKGMHEALAMLLAHDHRRDAAQDSEGAAAEHSTNAKTVAANVPVSTAALESAKITSVKVETHFAPAGTRAVAADVASNLSGLNGARGAQGPKPADPTAAKPAVRTGTDGELGGNPHAANAPDPTAQPVVPAANGDNASRRGFNASARGDRAPGDGPRAAKGAGPSEESTLAAAAVGDKPAQTGATALPMQQIGGRLVDVASEMKSVAQGSAASAASNTSTAQTGPVRVLSIDLHPAELGSVTVRMSLVGDAIGVQIEADRPETARLLKHDSSALSDMLRTAGLQVDGIMVRAAQMDGVSAGAGSSQSFMNQQSQSQSGGAQGDAQASGGNNGRGRDPQSFAGRQQDQGPGGERRPQPRAGGGVYV